MILDAQQLSPGTKVRLKGEKDIFEVLQDRGSRLFVRGKLVDTEIVKASAVIVLSSSDSSETYSEALRLFAWLPTKLQSGWIWLKPFLEKRLVEKTRHGCHDCFNPLSPCDGGAFDYSITVLSREAINS